MDNKNFPIPDDISNAIHLLITSFAGGYEAMAMELCADATHNMLRNRVRQISGQSVPFGMALAMEQISERTDITEAMCQRAGGVFVKLPEVDQVDNEELLIKFNDLLSALGNFAQAHNQFTADGILDNCEKKRLKAKGYKIQTLVAEIYAVTVMLFGEGDAPSMQLSASATKSMCVEK